MFGHYSERRIDIKEILLTELRSLANNDLQMAFTSPTSCNLESRFTDFKTWYPICKAHLHTADVTQIQKKV